MLRLRTFGGLSLQGGSEAITSTVGKRPLALLALLAVAGARGVRREKAVALLWPESDEERGRNSLSQALTALRRVLGPEAVDAGVAELRLTPGVLSIDAQEFEAAMASNELERAVELYDGPFLDGVHLKSAQLEEWIQGHRARLACIQANALERLAREAHERGDPAASIARWRRLSALEPASARATLGLMRSLAATGERAAALQHYRVYETLMREEFDAEPDEAVMALAAQLKSGCVGPEREQAAYVAVPRDSAAPHTVDAGVSTSHRADGIPLDRSSLHATRYERRSGRHVARWFAMAAVVGVTALSVFAARDLRTAGRGDGRLAVVPFRNLTRDSTFDALGALAAEHIIDGAQRAGLLDVADPMTAAFITAEIRDSVDALDDASEVKLVGEAVRARFVVSGTVSRDGDSLVIVARLTDAARNALASVSEPVRVSTAAPEGGLSIVRQRALGLLAVTSSRSFEDVRPIGSSSPPTLAAYTEYLEGLARFQRREEVASIPYFERAYAADSTFVAPLVWLAWAVNSVPDGLQRQQAIVQELGRHRARLGPVDREALAYLEATVRADEAGRTIALQRASALAPGSIWTYNVANQMNGLGRYDEAVAAFEQIDRRHGWIRSWPVLWRQYARALHYVDHERELAIVREARSVLASGAPNTRRAWWVGLLLDEGKALASLGRRDELAQVIEEIEAVSDPARAVGNALTQLALELRSRGDTAMARETIERALAWYRARPAADLAAPSLQADYAEAMYAAGLWREAQVIFGRLATESPNDWTYEAWVGLCAARLGDRLRAQTAMERIEAATVAGREVNPIVAGRAVYLARIAAVLGERDRAVAYIKRLNEHTGSLMPRHASHDDFASLAGYAPFKQVTRPVP
jgi:DNA-binding SARP family transcriptional activator/TolB-like protein